MLFSYYLRKGGAPVKNRIKIEILVGVLIFLSTVYLILGALSARQSLSNQIQRQDRAAVIPLLGFIKTYDEKTTDSTSTMKDTGWMLFIYDLPPYDDSRSKDLQTHLKNEPLTAVKVGRSQTKQNDILGDTRYWMRYYLRGFCDNPPTLPIILYKNHMIHPNLWEDLDAITIVVETEKQLDLLSDAQPGTLFLPSWLNEEHWANVRDKLILQAKPKEIVYLDCN